MLVHRRFVLHQYISNDSDVYTFSKMEERGHHYGYNGGHQQQQKTSSTKSAHEPLGAHFNSSTRRPDISESSSVGWQYRYDFMAPRIL